ncbi:hypothetical protein P152DRAFT_450910 [Eremomyces bilateralis CBS 781.70]|uniref:Uncharacterized protein n=1 Tax=Eremomyces bilateralis CBS 781.70 TaxID=1392243 RepID=A0A6G1FXU3_9PEZI|nr:uncharacterized protein P152DRAFT_450910 [Eremomyces bilateralis CBS 781.70]KAF1810532.1 hypothetical protein P152DRAFT_450910 [Eremomyces bilateralis CBS 781.70]
MQGYATSTCCPSDNFYTEMRVLVELLFAWRMTRPVYELPNARWPYHIKLQTLGLISGGKRLSTGAMVGIEICAFRAPLFAIAGVLFFPYKYKKLKQNPALSGPESAVIQPKSATDGIPETSPQDAPTMTQHKHEMPMNPECGTPAVNSTMSLMLSFGPNRVAQENVTPMNC